MGLCKFCGEKEAEAKSHIIPKSFYNYSRFYKNYEKLSMLNVGTFNKRVPSPIGEYDENILCSDCEAEPFQQLDNFGKLVLIDGLENLEESNECWIYRDTNFNFDMFRLFIISVLWRASVTNRPAFDGVNLGRYCNPPNN